MATSTLKFYKSEILVPGKNAMYSASANNSQFETYLQTCWRETTNNFQYIKHDLFVSIKVAKPQSAIAEIDPAYPYNYVSIKNSDDDRTFYYFIAAANWKAQMTVELSLAMDTVATYWDQISFNDKTTLIREHKDRFVVPSSDIYVNSVLTRKVDNVDEGVNTTQIKDQTITILDTALPNSTVRPRLQNLWYLVYRSEFSGTDVNQSPVNCYLCADEDLQVESSSGDVTWNTDDLDDNKIYYAIVRDNPNATIAVENGSSVIRTYQLGGAHSSSTTYKVFKLYWDSVSDYWVARALYYNNGGSQTYSGYEGLNDIQYVGFTGGANIVWVATANQEIIDATDYSWIDRYYATSAYATKTETGNTTDGYILSIDNSFDRTDTRILKIIELPYCPSDLISYNDVTDLWTYDSNVWTFVDAKLKLKSLGASFERFLGRFEIPNMNYTITDLNQLRPAATRNDDLESKMYHSAIGPIKLVYDSFAIDYARERYTHSSILPAAEYAIDFKQTNTINSKLGFKVRTTSGSYKEEQDFDNLLLATRNNESMIYNSEYLNYIRNGYNYDKKANSIQVAQSILNSVIGMGTSIARMGLQEDVTSRVAAAKGKANATNTITVGNRTIYNWGGRVVPSVPAGSSLAATAVTGSSVAASLGIGALSSGLSSVVNMAATIAQNQNSMEGKLAQLKAQSISTAGSDDLDLMKWYSGNTLKEITYKPVEPVKEALLDMFYYGGYSCNNIKGLPDMYSRTNWNFIQCEPVLQPVNETNIYQKYLDDIKERFAIGLTVFHNATDFNQVSNNTEISIANKIAQ